ncbi:MAG: hypothetical protein JJU02_00040 [Cryomorphaceae bacterium]|nr:hypothetical protein [Cryomorphaceae bacterium]
MQRLWIFLLLWTSATMAVAQDIPVWTWDTTEIRLGEPITVTFTATIHKDSIARFPNYEPWSDQTFVIIDNDTAVVEKGKNRRELHQTLIVTSFDTGYHVMEPIEWRYDGQVYESEVQAVEVEWVMIEEGMDLYDIKNVLGVPRPWHFYVFLILTIAAILLALYNAWQLIRERKVRTKAPPEIEKSPLEIAMEKLRDLDASKIWEEEKYGLFFLDLTTILRQYIERTSGIRAMEATLDELMVRLDNLDISDQDLQTMKLFFQQAELIKYAKQTPARSSKEKYLNEVMGYIRKIKPPSNDDAHV